MNLPLRVAIVGAGAVSESHVKGWRNAGARIVAVCDKNISIAKSKAEKWGVKQCYEDVYEMVKKEKLDATSICTPPNVRLDVVKPLIEKGIHVVIEKPFALSVGEATRIVEYARKYGVKLTVAHIWLFSHIMKRILHCLEREEIGEVIRVEMNMLHTKNEPMISNKYHWCHRIKAGRFGENLPHPLYTMRAILGEIKIEHISGFKLGSYQWMPIDELYVFLKNNEGQAASIYISFNSCRPETTIRIFGTESIIEANLSNNILIKKRYREIRKIDILFDNLQVQKDILVSSLSASQALIMRRYQGMHTEFIKEFVSSLKNNTELPVTLEEALEVVKIWEKLCSQIHKHYFSQYNS